MSFSCDLKPTGNGNPINLKWFYLNFVFHSFHICFHLLLKLINCFFSPLISFILVFSSKFLEGLVSYSIPKGVQRGLEIDLSDQTYDGRDEGDRLVDGLGQLVDGQVGTDNYRTDIHGYGKGMYVCPVCPSATIIGQWNVRINFF